MPIHDMAWWVPMLDNVILFLEDPCKKQLVGLLCSVKKLNNALAPTNVEKRFRQRIFETLMLWLSFKNGSNSRSSLNWRGKTPQEIPKEVLNTL
jgi:hypothetical protein